MSEEIIDLNQLPVAELMSLLATQDTKTVKVPIETVDGKKAVIVLSIRKNVPWLTLSKIANDCITFDSKKRETTVDMAKFYQLVWDAFVVSSQPPIDKSKLPLISDKVWARIVKHLPTVNDVFKPVLGVDVMAGEQNLGDS